MARKKKTKSWKDTFEFYGIKNYTWNNSMKSYKKDGVWFTTKKEWGMIGKALKSGKLSYGRLFVESFVYLSIGFLSGMLVGEIIIWMIG